MSKAIKAVTSLSATALVLSASVVVAAPPQGVNFDDWTVTGGTIATDCPTLYTCSGEVNGNGFYQDLMTLKSDPSRQYFRTIITDKDSSTTAGLTFSDENYVQMGANNGIADKAFISDTKVTSGASTITETFSASSEVSTGWAAPNGDEVKLYQGVLADESGAAGNDFLTNFWLAQVGTNGVQGKLMRISGAVDIDKTSQARQDFTLVQKSNPLLTKAGSVSLSDGSTLSWANGDDIKAIWVGQDMSQVSGVSQDFGFTSYDNLTSSAEDLITEFSLDSGASDQPVNWDTTDPTNPATQGIGWGDYSATNLNPYQTF